jgi:hypothetical protein
MGPKFDRDTGQFLKCMLQQHEFTFGIHWTALNPCTVPRRANFDPLSDLIDIHIGGHADGPFCGTLNYGEWQHGTRFLETASPLDFLGNLVWRGY